MNHISENIFLHQINTFIKNDEPHVRRKLKKMDFEEAFAKCISDGNVEGIKSLGVDKESVNDIVCFLFIFSKKNDQY